MPARLLCVGKDLALLRTRCAVLSQSGYDAQSASVPETQILLRTEEFDLIIVSAFLDEWEKGCILSAAGKLPAYPHVARINSRSGPAGRSGAAASPCEPDSRLATVGRDVLLKGQSRLL
jgi:hypothetical protein